MKTRVLAAVALGLFGCWLRAADAPAPLTRSERFSLYAKDAFGPASLLRSSWTAAAGQLGRDPPDWGQGAAGYGRRFASGLGRSAVAETVEYGVGSLIGEDPRYFRRASGSAASRVSYALRSTLLAGNPDGRRRFAAARIAGIYGGAAIAIAGWYPSRYTVTGDGFRLANIALAGSAAANVLREFWPDVKRRLWRKPAQTVNTAP